MSVCGQTEEESASEEAGPGSREAYEQKAVSKVVRVLTVLAYLLSVSLAAILLSVYYVCVWKSPELPPLNGTRAGEVAARRADPADHWYNETHQPNFTGGGGVSVNDTLTHTAPVSVVNRSATTTSAPQPSTDASENEPSSYSTFPDVNGTDAMRADNSSVT